MRNTDNKELLRSKNIRGKTPLMLAESLNHIDIVNFLKRIEN
jgi:hypothetical protein